MYHLANEGRSELAGMVEYLSVGEGNSQRSIAYRWQQANSSNGLTGLFWLGGFKSDMDGSKASKVAEVSAQHDLDFVRFDYSGHGLSDGEFLDGTISQWLEDASSVYNHTADQVGGRILIGSSMGGWIALLLNELLRKEGRSATGIILLAPAVDMTHDLMWEMFTEEEKSDLVQNGQLRKPSDYSDEPYILTNQLIEDGNKHLYGDRIIQTGCPVHILQGALDTDVPTAHSLKLLSRLTLDDVNFTLLPKSDHRLSSPADLERLRLVIEQMIKQV